MRCVWPAGWQSVNATKALIRCARSDATDRMLGHLFTTWIGSDLIARLLLDEPGPAKPSRQTRRIVEAMRAGAEMFR